MRKVCAECGTGFDTIRPQQAKFCSSRCRTRAHRRVPGPVAPPGDMPPGPSRGVETATLAALNEAGKAGSPLGEAVLVLARRIDGSSSELGTSLASLVREFRASLTEVVKDARPAANALDELRARRERRSAG